MYICTYKGMLQKYDSYDNWRLSVSVDYNDEVRDDDASEALAIFCYCHSLLSCLLLFWLREMQYPAVRLTY